MLTNQSAAEASPHAVSTEVVKVDEVKIFMVWVLTGGDSKRASAITQVDERIIAALAHDFDWKAKLNGRQALHTEKGQEDERAVNRLTNYVTAERLARVYSRLVDELDSDPTFARAFCTQIDDVGERSFNTKNLVDLAKGLQIVNDIKYRALQDKQAQAADVVSKADSAASFSVNVYKALAARFDHNVVLDPATEIAKAVDDARTPEAD